MKPLLERFGIAGLLGIALLAAAVAFAVLVLQPLEERVELMSEKLSRVARRGDDEAARKVAALYRHLQRAEDTTDWLAKLHGIGVATGLELKSASYRTQKTDGRIVRFEIVLPVEGSYPQIRDFLRRSLAEIPVLSVDSLALRREGRALHAEMRLTLHMVKS